MKVNYKKCNIEFLEQKRFPTKEKGKIQYTYQKCSASIIV